MFNWVHALIKLAGQGQRVSADAHAKGHCRRDARLLSQQSTLGTAIPVGVDLTLGLYGDRVAVVTEITECVSSGLPGCLYFV